jgi:transposase-like protein
MKQFKPRSKLAKALAELVDTENHKRSVKSVAIKHEIPPSTLYSAWKKVRDVRASNSSENDPRPMNRAMRLVEPRGATSHRLLRDDEESAVVNELRKRYPNGFTDHIITRLCIELTRNTRNHPRSFSRSFLRAFKHRNGIREAQFVPIKRIMQDPVSTFEADVEAACFFLDEVQDLTSTIPPHLFINVDETPSYVRNAPSHALHFIDTPYPWAWTRTSERDKVTVIGACTGEGTMLQSGIVAKGSTTQCQAKYLHQIGDISFIQHTRAGVTNTHSFIEYIDAVIVPYINNQPAVLIVDAYRAHLTKAARDFCDSKQIHLIKVPDRATSILQPLDVGVFGLAKLDIYREAKEHMFELIRGEEDRWTSTAACVEALSRVSVRAVQRGWKAVFPFWKEFLIQSCVMIMEDE